MLKGFNKPMSSMLNINNLLRYQWNINGQSSRTTKYYKVHMNTPLREETYPLQKNQFVTRNWHNTQELECEQKTQQKENYFPSLAQLTMLFLWD